MRLLNVHIDDFGKLSNFDMDFTANPMIVSAENGWGKSTLAAFIRIMFYGFEGESKKKNIEKERFRYKPWNKGNYGGRIIFEVNGREYELTRHFGSKEKEDTGSLIDICTMLSDTEYKLDNLGEQIFGIDAESFVRTLFAGQGKTEVVNEGESIGDGIAAKIGNLTEATDDIYSYEFVHNKLLAKSRELKNGYKKGIINEQEALRTEIIGRINSGKGIRGAVEDIEEKIKREEAYKETYIARVKELDKEIQLSGKKEAVKIWQDRVDQLQQERIELESRLESLKNRFRFRIPAIEETDEMIQDAGSLQKLQIELEEYNQNKPAQMPVEVMPGEGELEEYHDKSKRLDELGKELRDVRYDIKTQNERNEFLRDQRSRDHERKTEAALKEYKMKQSEEIGKAKRKGMIIFAAGMLLLFAAVLCVVFINKAAGIAGLLVALVLLASGILVMTAGANKAALKVALPEPVDGPDFEDLKVRTDELIQHERTLMAEEENLLEELNCFFAKHGLEYKRDTASQVLYALWTNYRQSEADSHRRQVYEEKLSQQSLLTEKLEKWIGEIGVDLTGDYLLITAGIADILKEISRIRESLVGLDSKLEISKAQKPVADQVDLELIRDAEIIEQQRQETAEKLRKTEGNIKALAGQLGGLREELDAVAEDEELLAVISDKIDENMHKYDIILKTADYMEKAKARLTSRYMQPISDAFSKYYEYICEGDSDSYKIDANINVTREELGERRSTLFLSKGYKDLVDIALRMALLDVMYDGEKPFVVLDDPFVNLDTQKLDKAREFLAKLSADYQVIYFTCHQSRA